MKKIFGFLVIVFLSNFQNSTAFAEDEIATPEREPAAVHITDRAQLKQYPGGRDEQDIKVQSSLPQPAKNIDGTAVGEMILPDDHD